MLVSSILRVHEGGINVACKRYCLVVKRGVALSQIYVN